MPTPSLRGLPLCRLWTARDREATWVKQAAKLLKALPLSPAESEHSRAVLVRALVGAAKTLEGAAEPLPAALHRHYRIALDYRVTLERLGGKGHVKAATGEVMDAHGIGRTVVTDARRDYGRYAWSEFRRLVELNRHWPYKELLGTISREIRKLDPKKRTPRKVRKKAPRIRT